MQESVGFRAVQTIVIDAGGEQCTEVTAKAAVNRAMELGIGHIVIASGTGGSAFKLQAAARDAGYQGQIVVVGSHTGKDAPGQQLMGPEVRRQLESGGAKVFIGTYALSGISRSFRLKWGGIDLVEAVADTLRLVSRGTKVCFEISVMAADAGLIPVDQDVVAIAGSSGGSDTALVIRPANMNRFLDIKVREFIAMPR